ncbi:hypothetical protein HGB13_02800 [bacterium]|nr:hypothetical protein [bacterium]
MANEHIIYIEGDEEITSVISRLKKERAKNVTLVVPKGALMLQSIVNLKMLKRSEKSLGKEITFVTTDKTGLHLASEVGFIALRALDAEPEGKDAEVEDDIVKEAKPSADDIAFTKKEVKEKSNKDNGPKIVFTEPLEQNEEDVVEPEIKSHKIADKKELPKEKKKKKLSKAMKRILIGFGSLIGIMAILGLIFVLPKVTITVTPLAEELRQDVEIKIPIDGSGNIKSEVLEITKDAGKEVATTGTKNVGEKAKGTITAYNYWDSTPQPLVLGTRFSTDGKIYKTTSNVTVPGTTISGGNPVPGTVNVSVEASEAGDVYNVGPSNFTIPGLPAEKQAKIYGKSSAPMTGGSTRQVKVVSSQDIDTVKNALNEEMLTSGKEELSKKAGDKKILDAAIKEEIIKEEFSNKEGEEAEKLALNYSKKFWVIAFSEVDVKNEITNKVKETLDENREIVENQFGNLDYKVIESSRENGLLLSISATLFSTEKLELDRSKDEIAGKSEEDVIKYFKQKESIQDVQVDYWPFWVKKVPLNKSRIIIEVNVKSSNGQNTSN